MKGISSSDFKWQILQIKVILELSPKSVRESFVKNHFPAIYAYINNLDAPKDNNGAIMNFLQKLWHVIHKDCSFKLGICPICMKRNRFRSGSYMKYCSSACVSRSKAVREKYKNTCFEKYGVSNIHKTAAAIERTKETNIIKYGGIAPICNTKVKHKITNTCIKKYGKANAMQNNKIQQKVKNTCKERYGVEYAFQSDAAKEKYKITCKERYGVENVAQSKVILNKIDNTKRSNGTFNTSSIEEKINNKFIENNIRVTRQYKSEDYPFKCDFYLVDYQLYIEINGTWLHGGIPFDSNNSYCISQLNKWKTKKTKFYDEAIKIWTIRDPLKRSTAKNNHLNYLEVFSNNIDESWRIICDYINKLNCIKDES